MLPNYAVNCTARKLIRPSKKKNKQNKKPHKIQQKRVQVLKRQLQLDRKRLKKNLHKVSIPKKSYSINVFK